MSHSVSVVIPCFNAARYISETIASVRAQVPSPHYHLHEIIVVDDGSTDGSADVVRSVDADVRIVAQVNSGISEARNAGLREATGAWIAFLDADDIWPADSLSTRAALLDTHSDVAVVAGFVEQFVSPDVSDDARQRIVLPDGPIQGRLAGALLVRRETFDAVGTFSAQYSLGETIDWVARAETAGHVMRAVESVVVRRRIHKNNSVQKREQLKSDYLSVLRAAIGRRRAAESAGGQPTV